MLAVSFFLVNLGFLGWKASQLKNEYGKALDWKIVFFGAITFGVFSGCLSNWTNVGVIAISTFGWVSLLADASTSRLPTLLTALMGFEVLIGGVAFLGVGTRSSLVGAAMWFLAIGVGRVLRVVGRGDLYLAPVLGFWLGNAWLVGLVVACFTAGIWAVITAVRGRKRFPFGPHLIVGAYAAWLAQYVAAQVI